ncbi:hypothetical protein JNJ66_04745 [Candidatus Saccharibacteria bacterium]|nr:hypothetical protein [Candidatus Saccharibacteria bacterium]
MPPSCTLDESERERLEFTRSVLDDPGFQLGLISCVASDPGVIGKILKHSGRIERAGADSDAIIGALAGHCTAVVGGVRAVMLGTLQEPPARPAAGVQRHDETGVSAWEKWRVAAAVATAVYCRLGAVNAGPLTDDQHAEWMERIGHLMRVYGAAHYSGRTFTVLDEIGQHLLAAMLGLTDDGELDEESRYHVDSTVCQVYGGLARRYIGRGVITAPQVLEALQQTLLPADALQPLRLAVQEAAAG